MRRVLPLTLLSATLAVSNLYAQNDRFAYAITDATKETAGGWNTLRRIDLQTGQYSDVLLNGLDDKTAVYSASTKKQLSLQPDARYGTIMQSPFATGVAAAAYDKKHNRLYFTPMFVDQLRYIDLKTMKVYYVDDQAFTKLGNMHNDEAKIISRMVITPDGNGYAISNDGNTFVRFSTGKKSTTIEQLGSLVDDASNNGISIHNRCSSFGGDVISDDKGNLFIISARNHVFQLNTETRIVKHLGTISGLDANFTTNGAVVDGDGNLLVSSAVDGNSYYVVDAHNWSASPYKAVNGIYRSSDLANSNFLSEKKHTVTPSDWRPVRPSVGNGDEDKFLKLISIYPNPVTNNNITVQFAKVPNGSYTVELRDALGRSVQQKKITINSEMQTQEFKLNPSSARGMYLVKVFDVNSRTVFTQKLVVQ